jgi:hypothetical protein
VALALEADREADRATARWARATVYAEASPLLEGNAEGPGDAWGRAQRRLRAEGLVSCPRCCSPLATDADLERLQRWRERRIRAAEIRRAAVEATEESAVAVDADG